MKIVKIWTIKIIFFLIAILLVLTSCKKDDCRAYQNKDFDVELCPKNREFYQVNHFDKKGDILASYTIRSDSFPASYEFDIFNRGERYSQRLSGILNIYYTNGKLKFKALYCRGLYLYAEIYDSLSEEVLKTEGEQYFDIFPRKSDLSIVDIYHYSPAGCNSKLQMQVYYSSFDSVSKIISIPLNQERMRISLPTLSQSSLFVRLDYWGCQNSIDTDYRDSLFVELYETDSSIHKDQLTLFLFQTYDANSEVGEWINKTF